MAAFLVYLDDHHAFQPKGQNVDMVFLGPGHFADRRARADGEQIRRARRIGGSIALRHHNDFFVLGGDGCLDGRQRGGASHGERHQQPREQH